MPVNAQRGDLLIQGDVKTKNAFHSLIWVGGNKPLVHNISKGRFIGVIRQANYPANMPVFRLRDGEVAEEAAKLAENWADTPGETFQLPQSNPSKIVLKSPYSQQRMEDALYRVVYEKESPWSVDALFRVLKAIARANDGSGLSPTRGLGCTQFAAYCFQAAALKIRLGPVVPADLIARLRVPEPEDSTVSVPQWMAKNKERGDPADFWQEKAFNTQKKIFPSLKTKDGDIIRQILSGEVEKARGVLPSALDTDAKFMTVEKLLAAVLEPDSGFDYVGTLKSNDEPNGPSHLIWPDT
jgi:hypothetical protein